jgi:hypothetical protein
MQPNIPTRIAAVLDTPRTRHLVEQGLRATDAPPLEL